MRKPCYPYLLLLALLSVACSSARNVETPVELTWVNGGFDEEKELYINEFIIRNLSDRALAADWDIYYSQLPKKIVNVEATPVQVEVVNANYFRMSPTQHYAPVQPGDSLVVKFYTTSNTINLSRRPEGCYLVSRQDSSIHLLPLKFRPLTDKERMQSLSAERIYDKNRVLDASVQLGGSEVLPTLKSVTRQEAGSLSLASGVSLSHVDELSGEADLLKEKLTQLYGIQVAEGSPVSIRLALFKAGTAVNNDEQYRLEIAGNQVLIEGATPHGVFNGCQTLLALLKGKQENPVLDYQTVVDYPDLQYRGFMFDVARNFTPLAEVKKLIDWLSSYKINVLHLHVTDDEGWRLEIPGLEELTEVGAHRGHTTDELTCLYPCYNGDYRTTEGTGNGYYTRQEFIDLLQYAAQRHVRIIPEIEAPGHARAAIVAMKARYHKYIDQDEQKACEYLLSEPADSSVYVSAQAYTDNVINVALPSTYRFMEKVVTEILAMYKDAGVELYSLHLGGDEVPRGAWMKSPACQKLMAEQHMTRQHDLFEYFYCRMADFMTRQGVQFSGWQEVALHNNPQTDRKLDKAVKGIYCWNTVPEWKGDVIPYQVANNQYPVILCNVNNFYMDLAYSPHYEERGLSWAGYVDESKSFSMLPFSIYRSARVDLKDNPVDLDHATDGKPVLQRPENIKGVQAQLFSETIRKPEWVEYYIFPKILGLAERGWNAHPAWETLRGDAERQAFNLSLSRFYALLSAKELPYLNKLGANFRLPHVGLKVEGGLLYANSPLRDAVIRYTTDGTEPAADSTVWTEPVKCDAAVVKARLFYLGRESVTTIWSKERR